jgi:hypothetical protein
VPEQIGTDLFACAKSPECANRKKLATTIGTEAFQREGHQDILSNDWRFQFIIKQYPPFSNIGTLSWIGDSNRQFGVVQRRAVGRIRTDKGRTHRSPGPERLPISPLPHRWTGPGASRPVLPPRGCERHRSHDLQWRPEVRAKAVTIRVSLVFSRTRERQGWLPGKPCNFAIHAADADCGLAAVVPSSISSASISSASVPPLTCGFTGRAFGYQERRP